MIQYANQKIYLYVIFADARREILMSADVISTLLVLILTLLLALEDPFISADVISTSLVFHQRMLMS